MATFHHTSCLKNIEIEARGKCLWSLKTSEGTYFMEGMHMGIVCILSSGDAEPSKGEQNGTFNGTFFTCMVKGDVGAS